MRFAARRAPSVEALLEQLDVLSRERQELRDGNAAVDELERNRLEIVGAQWELSRALIRRHLSEHAPV
jgi:hypothetical protein